MLQSVKQRRLASIRLASQIVEQLRDLEVLQKLRKPIQEHENNVPAFVMYVMNLTMSGLMDFCSTIVASPRPSPMPLVLMRSSTRDFKKTRKLRPNN